jgi:hypothetical protein
VRCEGSPPVKSPAPSSQRRRHVRCQRRDHLLERGAVDDVLRPTRSIEFLMAVIVKMQSAAPAPDGVLAVDSIWNYRKQTLEIGDEAFIWFTKADEAEGLAMRGILEHIAPAGTSANGRQLVSLRLNITHRSPGRSFTIAALHPYKGSTATGALPKLAGKLLRNSHGKVARLENDEVQHLQTFFAGPVGGVSERLWRELERDASLAARSRIGARLRRDIEQDIASSAMEGLTQEQRIILRSRAAWLAARFTQKCWDSGEFRCDECGFEPCSRGRYRGQSAIFDGRSSPRSAGRGCARDWLGRFSAAVSELSSFRARREAY